MDGNSIKLLGGGEPTTRWPPAAAVASHYKFKWMVIAHLVLRKGARSGAAKKKKKDEPRITSRKRALSGPGTNGAFPVGIMVRAMDPVVRT